MLLQLDDAEFELSVAHCAGVSQQKTAVHDFLDQLLSLADHQTGVELSDQRDRQGKQDQGDHHDHDQHHADAAASLTRR